MTTLSYSGAISYSILYIKGYQRVVFANNP